MRFSLWSLDISRMPVQRVIVAMTPAMRIDSKGTLQSRKALGHACVESASSFIDE